MSEKLRNEVQSALPSARSRAQEALRHHQCFSEVDLGEGEPMLRIDGLCVVTGKNWCTLAHPQDLLFTGLRLWALGTPAQAALSFMSADEREFIISGISPKGWDEMFKERA